MNGHAGIDTVEATEHLKNILNVGKADTESATKLISVSNGNMDISNNGTVGSRYQRIELGSKDGSNVSIYGTHVVVYSSALDYEANSNQIVIDSMVDYGWEEKYYPGKLVTVHLTGKYLAYCLRSSRKSVYIRVIKTNTDIRQLIKDHKTEVKDVAFSHSSTKILLGSVDACGELLVHKIDDEELSLTCVLLVRILRPTDWLPSDYNRVIWCLYIPDEDVSGESTSDDASSLLVVTHNEQAEIWNIDNVLNEHGIGSVTTNQARAGVQVINGHSDPISTATFSPDGSALAIASLDGVVKFFQVNTSDRDLTPRCLHQWTPHEGKPLSSLYFLDNHKNHKPDVQFWKFAVTGADDNTELKVWSCETWECLQTIRVLPNLKDDVKPCLKAEFDLTSTYLFLSDLKRKVLFIILFQQDQIGKNALACSISEYSVPYPVLSIAISSIVKHLPPKDEKLSDDEDERSEGDTLDSAGLNHGFLVKLYWIHTKSLQFCRIVYHPKVVSPVHSIDSVSSLSQDSFVYKDALSDISLDIRDSSNRSIKDELCSAEDVSSNSETLTPLTSHHLPNFGTCSEVLLTPKDFTSPSHSNIQQAQNSFLHLEDGGNVSCDSVTRSQTDAIDSLPADPSTLVRRKSSQHSTTSSPSREVAEILSTNKNHSDELENEPDEIKIKTEPLSNSVSSFKKSTSRSSGSEWPHVPDTSKDFRISSTDPKGHQNDDAAMAFELSSRNLLFKLNQSIDDLSVKMMSLADVTREHEITKLQNEIEMLRQDQKHDYNLSSLENVLTEKMECVITQHAVPEYSRVENLILRKENEDQQRLERQLTNFSKDVSTDLREVLVKVVHDEINKKVLPEMTKMIDSLSQQVQMKVIQKLADIDHNLQNSIAKHLNSKVFTECMSSCMQQHIQVSCKEVFQKSVVPSFNECCTQLFLQLTDTFNKGTIEYTQFLKKHSQSTCSSLDATVKSIQEEMVKMLSSIRSELNELTAKEQQRSIEFQKQKEAMLVDIRRLVQDEVRKTVKEQMQQMPSTLSSRSASPIVVQDPQFQKQHLMNLVKQGQINDAFQQALTLKDVQLVLYLCETLSVDQVFGPNSTPLQQHVLLSLLNQLSADLFSKTELKVGYIEDVIASLDSDNVITREHIGSVLEGLQHNITLFLQRNPSHKLTRNFKRISMAIQALRK